MGYEYPWYSPYSGYGGQQTRSSNDLCSNTDDISHCNYWPAGEPTVISDNSRAYHANVSNSAWSRSPWPAQQPGSASCPSDTNFRWHTSPARVFVDAYSPQMEDTCYTLPCAALLQPDDVATAFCPETVANQCVKLDNPDIAEVIPRADIFNQFLVSVLGQTPSKTTFRSKARETYTSVDDTTGDKCDEYRATSVKTESSRLPEVMDIPSCQTYSMCRDFLLPRADSWQSDDATTSPGSTIGCCHNNVTGTRTEVDKWDVIDGIFQWSVTSSEVTDPKPFSRTCKSVETRKEATNTGKQTLPCVKKSEAKHVRKPVKQFVCDECSKGFAQRSGLRVHMRLHNGIRPYSCADCDRSFSDNSVYVRHRRTHTHERPYVCSECGYRFTQSGNLLRHRRKQHGFGST